MEKVIEVSGLRKSFGEELVLDDISLELWEGKAIGIVGPNGSGKTTFLRILAGLEKADKGEMKVKGRVGYVHQENLLLPWKSIKDNISLGLKYNRIEGIESRVREVSRLFEITPHLNKYPSQVSGGTARKASIARILVLEPDILLLDEPFTGLDLSSRNALKASLKKVSVSRAMIIVSHVLEDLVGLVDEIYVFTPRPARIIGRLNLKDGTSYLELGERLAELYFSF